MVGRCRTRGALLGVLLVLGVGACGGTGGGGAVEASAGQTTGPGVPAQPTQAGVPGAGSGSGDSGDSNSGDGSSEPETVIDPNGDEKAPDDSHTVAIGDTFQVPALRGMDLQAAQDLLQGRNSYKLEQLDALGRGRKQIKDTDWRVCRQTPPVGRYVPIDTVVRLYAVHDGERCP